MINYQCQLINLTVKIIIMLLKINKQLSVPSIKILISLIRIFTFNYPCIVIIPIERNVVFYLNSYFFYPTKKKFRLSRNRMAFVQVFKMTPEYFNAFVFCRRQKIFSTLSLSLSHLYRRNCTSISNCPDDVQFQVRQK